MLNAPESILIIVLIVSGSVGLVWLIRYVWPAEQRRLHNDLIGWQVSILGTSYAVIIGFMLYAVWTNFQIADGNAEAEANSLVNVVRIAQGLPAPRNQEIRDLGSQYVEIMLTQEWPAMSRLAFSPMSRRVVRQLWTIMMNTPIHNASEQISLDHAMSELTKMTEYRRLQLQAHSDLPEILWAVLVTGAILTITSACLFDTANFKLHVLQVFMLSLMLSLVLVAISDINRPFQGSVHVSPAGFERARSTLNDLKSTSQGQQ
jgi:hypothetical protein